MGRHIPITITISSLPRHLLRGSLATQSRHMFERRAVDSYEELVRTFKPIKTLLLAATPFVPVQNSMAYRRHN